MVRITLSLTLMPLFLLGIFACGPEQSLLSEETGGTSHNLATSAAVFLKTDAEIIDNLKKMHGLTPKEMGGGGRCLFHSLRAQITKAELVSKKARWPHTLTLKVDNYATLDANAQANLLREIAIWEEKDLLLTQAKKDLAYEKLSPDEQAWALEMAKDWHQELESDITKTRHWFLENKENALGRQRLWNYVTTHKDHYWLKTSIETNWAGTAEAIALARVLARPLKMFGRDEVSDIRGARLDADGRVLPYTHYEYASTSQKPLLIFQCGGGGHYQMLEPQ